MREKPIDIGIVLPTFLRALEVDDLFILVENWEGVPLFIFPKEIFPLEADIQQMIQEKIEKEQEVFLRIFSY